MENFQEQLITQLKRFLSKLSQWKGIELNEPDTKVC